MIYSGKFVLVSILLNLIVSGALTACSTTHTTGPGAIGVDRVQRMSPLVPENEFNEGSRNAYKEILQQEKRNSTLNTDVAMTQRVRTIAERIVPHTAVFRPAATQWEWEANVVQSAQINAWCMPGGKMVVYSGIIEKLDLTDDELAAIMGHEIAHALREHARERASEQVVAGLVISAGAAVAGADPKSIDMTQMVYQTMFGLKNSRTHETEADRIGIELAARAGYRPDAAVSLWQKMAKVAGSANTPEFLSTHPSPATRIADLKRYAVRVQPLYQQALSSTN